ncbi:MAG: radical SAM protein [Candidatus Omnitrophota bacterium]|jgi:molybdenum cofactor biosynthesis enzyme MoaA
MIINKTTSYCCECSKSHAATIEHNGACINFLVDCPKGIKSSRISADAGIFLGIRRKYPRDLSLPAVHKGKKWSHLIEITDDCNFKCPVCYADAGSGPVKTFLTQEAVLERAAAVRKSGGKIVTLTGGEPTLHSDLPVLVRKITDRGLKVEIATNGMKIAQDPGYARSLKESGLQRAWLQLDTLNEDTHLKMRGNDFVEQKRKAAGNIIACGLRLGIIVTVTSLNINDIDSILEYSLTLGAQLDFIVFQVAAPAGRYQLLADTITDREAVIKRLMTSRVLHTVRSIDNFWPLPAFRPWQLEVHPDCSAILFLLVEGTSAQPIDDLINMPAFYRRLNANTMPPSFLSRNIVPIFYALRETSLKNLLKLMQYLYGFITGRGKKRMMVISIDSFLGAEYQDEQRLARCANSFVTPFGLLSPCIYNYPDKRRAGSRKNLEERCG